MMSLLSEKIFENSSIENNSIEKSSIENSLIENSLIETKVTAIVLAAGQGKRMNSSVAKQFLMLQDKPVIYYSIKAFEESSVDNIIIVTSSDQVAYCKEQIVERYHMKKVGAVIEGGKERYDSVYHALQQAGSSEYVLIHDGARPFITVDLIETLISRVKNYKACIVGTPVKETIKVVDEKGFIIATPNRNTLWSAQTPQAFEYDSIKKAYDSLYQDANLSARNITDDAMVYETFLQRPVQMIMGDYNNLKLTTPEDLLIANQIISHILCE